MKKKMPVIIVCAAVIIGVAICLCLDKLASSPEVDSIASLSAVIDSRNSVTIDSSNILDSFKTMAKSLKEVKKDENYNIDNFLVLTYGSEDKEIFLSSKYLIMNGKMYTGSSIHKLYSLISGYTSENRSIASYIDGLSFSLSPMDIPYIASVPASQEIIDDICRGSIDNTFVKSDESSDILSNVYAAQKFPSYRLKGTNPDNGHSADIYIIDSHLVYLDIKNGQSFFVHVEDDLYAMLDSKSLLKSVEPSEIYYLFNASSITYDDRQATNTASAVRALCGLYAIDSEDVHESLPLSVTALIGSKKLKIKVYEDYVSFNGMTFSSKGAASAFLRAMKED